MEASVERLSFRGKRSSAPSAVRRGHVRAMGAFWWRCVHFGGGARTFFRAHLPCSLPLSPLAPFEGRVDCASSPPHSSPPTSLPHPTSSPPSTPRALDPPPSPLILSYLSARIIPAMSGDVTMSSDDEKPIGLKRAQNGHNGHVASNGNGRAVDESSMSEDDDMPLVNICTWFPQSDCMH